MSEVFDHPQFLANGMAVSVEDPELGATTQVGVPAVLAATPGAVQGGQPRVGEHSRQVLAEAGYSDSEIDGLVESGAVEEAWPMGPLSGVVVLDLGQYLAGPYGAMLLADLGAEVIKVEPLRGDGMRMAGMPFLGCQRGKLDIAVDVKAPEGLEVVLRLAELADVVHHNMTKGTAARLGIDYESLRARHPDLVHCNTYAYGAEGPLSEFGGLDPLYQASCGLEYEAGPVAEGNPPLYLRFGMTDTANAMVSVVGVLAALYHQRRTGEGQDLWTSLLNGAAVFSSDVFLVDGEPGPVRPARPRPDRRVPLLPAVRDPGRVDPGGGVRRRPMVGAVRPGRPPRSGALRHHGWPAWRPGATSSRRSNRPSAPARRPGHAAHRSRGGCRGVDRHQRRRGRAA